MKIGQGFGLRAACYMLEAWPRGFRQGLLSPFSRKRWSGRGDGAAAALSAPCGGARCYTPDHVVPQATVKEVHRLGRAVPRFTVNLIDHQNWMDTEPPRVCSVTYLPRCFAVRERRARRRSRHVLPRWCVLVHELKAEGLGRRHTACCRSEGCVWGRAAYPLVTDMLLACLCHHQCWGPPALLRLILPVAQPLERRVEGRQQAASALYRCVCHIATCLHVRCGCVARVVESTIVLLPCQATCTLAPELKQGGRNHYTHLGNKAVLRRLAIPCPPGQGQGTP